MLYYFNKDGKFQKESSKEYKTEKGAFDRLKKEGVGAVFDETGKQLLSLVDGKDVPEGALQTNPDGSVPAFNEDNEQVGTVDAKTAAEATGESGIELDGAEQPDVEQTEAELDEAEQTGRMPIEIQTTCDSLRIRAGAGKDYRIVGYIREKAGDKKNHIIAEERNGWGKLASGEGWIELAFAKKVS